MTLSAFRRSSNAASSGGSVGSVGSVGNSRNNVALALFSFLSGVLVFVALSNVVQFHSLIIVNVNENTKMIPSIHVWLQGGNGGSRGTIDVVPSPPLQGEVVASAALVQSNNNNNNNNNQGDKPEQSIDDPLPDWPFLDPADTRFLVVHVGKAGGMSLNGKLKILDQTRKFLKCRRQYKTDEEFYQDACRQTPGAAAVAKLTLRLYGHVHRFDPIQPDVEQWLLKHTNVLLFTIRDPVDRLVSAFNYARWFIFEYKSPNKNKKYAPEAMDFFQKCFANMEECAGAIDPRNASTPAHECRDMALPVVQGRVQIPDLDHLYYNYQYYMKRVHWQPNNTTDPRAMVVVRTEHMWQDVARLEEYVGGPANRFLDPKTLNYKLTHGSEKYAVNKGLTAQHATAVCCVLSQPGQAQEMQSYQALVVHALNLRRSEKLDTLRSMHFQCGNKNAEGLTWKYVSNFDWDEWYQQSCRKE